MFGSIYITTNLIDGKQYIGKHKCDHFDYNYKGSGTALEKAFEKHGKANFECHILEPVNDIPTVCNSLEELNKSERYYTDYYDCVNNRVYYNLKPGGEGGSNKGYVCITSPDGAKCKKLFPEDAVAYIEQGWDYKGPIPSEETKLKRANSNRGQKRSAETRQNISKALTGKKKGPLSDDHKKKVGLAGQYNQPNMRKIKCIETGEIFKSLGEASRKLNIPTCNIVRNLKGGSPVKGHNFIDVE